MAWSDQFVKRLGACSPDLLDGSGRIPDPAGAGSRKVITPKFAARLDKEIATAQQLVTPRGVAGAADVFATAVSSIDDGLPGAGPGAFTDSYSQGGQEQQTVDQEPLPFRFTVDLVMIEGEWLVDDFNPVSSPTEPGVGDGTTEGSAP